MPSNKQQENFPAYAQYVPFLPLLLWLMGWLFVGQYALVPFIPFAISLVLTTVVYLQQLRYLQAQGRKLIGQRVLSASALALPFIAVFIGDLAGKAHFGDNAASGGLLFMSVTAAIFSLSVVAICAMANVFLIKPAIRTSALGKKILRVLGVMAQMILWVVVAAGAYFAAVLTYSARDPSTE